MESVKRKKCLRTCAKCTDPDRAAQGVIRAFAPLIHFIVSHIVSNDLTADSRDPDQTAHSRSLI